MNVEEAHGCGGARIHSGHSVICDRETGKDRNRLRGHTGGSAFWTDEKSRGKGADV
ncbi:hypothetical protein EMIT074MI3_20015 [Bacillus licheniformis]